MNRQKNVQAGVIALRWRSLTKGSRAKRPTQTNQKLSSNFNLNAWRSKYARAPLVMTPREVYSWDWGFFLTFTISNWNVAFNSGCVTCAFLNRKPVGRIYRSNLGGFRVKSSPTKHTLFTTRFHIFPARMSKHMNAFQRTVYRKKIIPLAYMIL